MIIRTSKFNKFTNGKKIDNVFKMILIIYKFRLSLKNNSKYKPNFPAKKIRKRQIFLDFRDEECCIDFN